MAFKHILAPAFSLAEDLTALETAAALAARFGARAAALIIAVHPGSEFAAETASLSEVLVDLAKGEGGAAATERRRIRDWLQAAPVPFDAHDLVVHAAIADREAVSYARLTDLTVMTRSAQTRRAHRMLLESLLFHSGRPVLLVPGDRPTAPLGERILVGWKPRREAVRAVHDALPLLRQAKTVLAVTVDADDDGDAPVADLAAHLARHGVRAEARRVEGRGRSESRALLHEAAEFGGDMIVMGAYGRSRAEETLFGGVTRDLLQEASVPLLLSH